MCQADADVRAEKNDIVFKNWTARRSQCRINYDSRLCRQMTTTSDMNCIPMLQNGLQLHILLIKRHECSDCTTRSLGSHSARAYLIIWLATEASTSKGTQTQSIIMSLKNTRNTNDA